VLHPWMRKHKAEATMVVMDAIIYQMWHAGISFANINKWLAVNGKETIKAYTVLRPGELKLFFKRPTQEERNACKTPINIVI